MKILTAAQMREVDRLTTEQYGIPSLQLMENAGTRVLEAIGREEMDLHEGKVVILCGKGNNGGDGLVVARLIKKHGPDPRVFLFANPTDVKGDAAVNLKRWEKEGGLITVVTSEAEWEKHKGHLSDAQLIVDALLGTGLKGPAEGLLARVIADVNERRGPRTAVVAVDIPSGLPSDGERASGPVVRANFTATFTAPKLGQVLPEHAEYVGKLHVGDIGSPAALLSDPALKLHWVEPGEFAGLPLRRRPGEHKGDFGHALILAGSRGKTGAAVLAAWGSLRAGVGLVTVGTPFNVQLAVSVGLPEMMTEGLAGTDADTISPASLDFNGLGRLTKGKSVLAMGPGLSTHSETQQFVRRVVAECELPIILDADGLNAFAGQASDLRNRKAGMLAVTPHPGEMARLCECSTADVQARRLEVAREAAAAWNAHVVLKGARTVIATPDGRAFINSTGNPGMATGGTGDVLTGILAGLTAQFGTSEWERVLSLGVYLHGLAGDLAAKTLGEASLTASDLIQMLPVAYQNLLHELPRG